MDDLLRTVIVEDSVSDAELIARRLKREGFALDWQRVECENEYLEALERGCDLVLSDWSLPDFSGLRALDLLSRREQDLPFIIVSGSIGEEAAVKALRLGASDYLLKDRLERLGEAVRSALQQKRLRDQHKQDQALLLLQSTALAAAANAIVITDTNGLIQWVNPSFSALTGYSAMEAIGKNPRDLVRSGMHNSETYADLWQTILSGKVWRGEMINRRKDGSIYFEEQTITPVIDEDGKIRQFVAIKQDISDRKHAEGLLLEKSQELSQAYDATLQGWSHALELRERETAGHSQRVVQMTLALAKRLGIQGEELIHVQRGALLHDIGKMGIPDGILLKPGPLNDEEWVIMRQHPGYAYSLLSKIPYLLPALDIPYHHHERWNGSGYPKGLKGEEIPLTARIFAVIDVWDALSHDRPYRPSWPENEVLNYLQEQAGAQFDPMVVDAFLELLRE